jgi:hypothetical protein
VVDAPICSLSIPLFAYKSLERGEVGGEIFIAFSARYTNKIGKHLLMHITMASLLNSRRFSALLWVAAMRKLMLPFSE